MAVAGFALLFGASLSARAGSLVGVYQKNGFEYLVNLGTGVGPLTYDANITEFGGSTAGALFSVVGVVDRNLVDDFGSAIGNIEYSKTGSPGSLSDDAILTAGTRVAGFGTSDSWFDLIPAIANGAPGTHTTIPNNLVNSFAVRVDNTFFGAFPFSIAGTIAADGTLTTSVYQAISSSDVNGTPQVNSLLVTLHVTPTGLAPEPMSMVLIGVALAGVAAVRRRSA
ncbi:MAG TPA: PEP-CTERM sorting domain-containing protein [Myxococcota bacterium]|nr:PEP-CTERM sorting domain-containing protein [Myxococcota bacterium]